MKYIILELKIIANENIDIDNLKELLLKNGISNLQCEGGIIHMNKIVGEIKTSKASVYPKD